MDPKWNLHKKYCQISKCNVSTRAKGPNEILRHYSTERHLRKDQRWRYDHLTIEDPLIKTPRYQVRGRGGKVLSNYQLQLELTHFIDSELIDNGDKPSKKRWLGVTVWHRPRKTVLDCRYPFLDTFCLCRETSRFSALYGDKMELLSTIWHSSAILIAAQSDFR